MDLCRREASGRLQGQQVHFVFQALFYQESPSEIKILFSKAAKLKTWEKKRKRFKPALFLLPSDVHLLLLLLKRERMSQVEQNRGGRSDKE